MESNKDGIDAEECEDDIEMKFPLLSFEKQIFIDAFEKDALVIMAKYVLQQLASGFSAVLFPDQRTTYRKQDKIVIEKLKSLLYFLLPILWN